MGQEIVGPSRRALFQTLAVVLLSMVPGLLIPSAKPIAYIVPLLYLLVERRRLGRSWEEIGVIARTFKRDLFHNWHLFLLVAIFLQLPLPLLAWTRWPALLQHIRERVPFLTPSSLGALVLTVVLIAFIEELVYRGLLQQRLAWYLNSFLAVFIASLVFGLQHFNPGPPAIVAADLVGVFLDGMVYGWIFARCSNVLVSWSAHVAADLVGVALIMLWF
jgi:membrane protease YdiL (CAAX protease family)